MAMAASVAQKIKIYVTGTAFQVSLPRGTNLAQGHPSVDLQTLSFHVSYGLGTIRQTRRPLTSRDDHGKSSNLYVKYLWTCPSTISAYSYIRYMTYQVFVANRKIATPLHQPHFLSPPLLLHNYCTSNNRLTFLKVDFLRKMSRMRKSDHAKIASDVIVLAFNTVYWVVCSSLAASNVRRSANFIILIAGKSEARNTALAPLHYCTLSLSIVYQFHFCQQRS